MSQQEINRKEAGVDDNPKLLSPPIVQPLYQCATAVVMPHFRIRLTAHGCLT